MAKKRNDQDASRKYDVAPAKRQIKKLKEKVKDLTAFKKSAVKAFAILDGRISRVENVLVDKSASLVRNSKKSRR